MNWLLYALGSILSYTALSLIQKVVADNSDSPQDTKALIFLGLGGLFYGLFERGRYQANKLLDASVFTTILTFGTVVAFVGSSILYQEAITLPKLLGATLVIISLIFVAKSHQKEKRPLSKRGLFLGLLVSTFMGLGWMLDKMGAFYFGTNAYSVYAWIFGLPVVFLPSIKYQKLKTEFLSSWQPLLILAGLNSLGYICQLEAVSLAEATQVIPLIQTSTLLTVILSIVILKERKNVPQKMLAAAIASVGIYFLV